MKTRESLVSNSSSSSFIVSSKIEDVATQMLGLVIEDFSGWGEELEKKNSIMYSSWKVRLEQFLKLKEVLNGEVGIIFPSCNYDTYILKKDDKCYIATSNNHMWCDLEFYDSTHYIGGGDDDQDDDNVYNAMKEENLFFWDVRSNKKITKSKSSNEVSKHWMCPTCGKDDEWLYFYKDDKGNKYCDVHHLELVKKSSVESSKEE